MPTIHDTFDYGYDPTVPEPGKCTPGQITACLNFLLSNSGTPSMQAAPEPEPNPLSACSAVWGAYGNGTITPDASFQPSGYSQVSVQGTQGLNTVRNLIAQ